MNQCIDYTCPYRNTLSGYCGITACIKPIPTYTVSDEYTKNALFFPHTIGDTTYYNKEELIEWVEEQQKFNKRILNMR